MKKHSTSPIIQEIQIKTIKTMTLFFLSVTLAKTDPKKVIFYKVTILSVDEDMGNGDWGISMAGFRLI